MPYVIPTSRTTTTPTVNFTASSLDANDDVVSYTATLTFSSAPSAINIRIQVGGTAVYYTGSTSSAEDWYVPSSSIESAGVINIPFAGGVTTLTFDVLVNENMSAASETQVMTLLPGAGYTVGTTKPVHTATISQAAVKPTSSNTGHGGLATTTYTGSYTLTQGLYQNLIFPNTSYYIERDNTVFRNCWFKTHDPNGSTTDGNPYGLYLRPGYRNVFLDECEFGDDGLVGHTSYSAQFFAHFNDEDRDVHIRKCHFHHAGWDHVKVCGNNWFIEETYFESPGTSVPWWQGTSAHGDSLQKDKNWTARNVDVYRCNFDMSVTTGDAGGYSYNACFQIDRNKTTQAGELHDCTFRSSWLTGGNYCLNSEIIDPTKFTNVSVRNCRIGTRKDIDYRHVMIATEGVPFVISGLISDHDGNRTPLDHNGQYLNNTASF